MKTLQRCKGLPWRTVPCCKYETSIGFLIMGLEVTADDPGYCAFFLNISFKEMQVAEDTVRREVMEEVGIKAKNITYYKSQPSDISLTNEMMKVFKAGKA